MPTPEHNRTLPPWRQPRWLAKAALSLVLILGPGAYLFDRYRIGIEDQKAKCLPPYTFWLIDTYAHHAEHNDVIAFRVAGEMEPWRHKGQIVLKRVAGLPGDAVVIDRQTTTVNGNKVGEGLALAKKLERPTETLERTLTVPDGHFWMMGDTIDSFDSRYWGPLKQDRMIGRAYALW
jgi:conjugal transfer pilin signal peptidase TrbI